jgi:hypothetical protein
MPFLRRLLDSDKIILGLLLFAVYVCCGVIIFPGWYYETLQFGGFPLLLRKAQTTFLPVNLLAVGLIVVFIFIVTYLEHFHLTLYERLKGLLPSRFLALLAGVVFVSSLFRLFSYSSEFTKLDILTEKVEALQERTAPAKLVTPPIDVIYINETKLLSIYSQIASSLQLKEKSIARKSTNSAKGETVWKALLL